MHKNFGTERSGSIYRIAVVADEESVGRNYETQITRFCTERGVFPQIELHTNQELFFERIQTVKPTSVVLALSGVAGLNAAEHLRSLCPNCGVIWCSDLDFSLQAFRLRVDYFLMEPITIERLREGLSVWFEHRRE